MDFPLELQSIILSHLSKAHQIIAKNVCPTWNDLVNYLLGDNKVTFEKAVQDLIVTDDLVTLRRIQTKIKQQNFDTNFCHIAASGGRLNILKWLIKNEIGSIREKTYYCAGKNNEIIRYLYRNRLGIKKYPLHILEPKLINIFARTGNTDMLQELFYDRIRIDDQPLHRGIIENALIEDRLNVLQWIRNLSKNAKKNARLEIMLSKCFTSKGSPVKCFEWILSKVPHHIDNIVDSIIEDLKWAFVPIIFNQLNVNHINQLIAAQIMVDIADSGNYELFQKLLAFGFKPNGCLKSLSEFMLKIFEPGTSHIIQLALEHGDTWDPELIDYLVMTCEKDRNLNPLVYAKSKKLKYNIISSNEIISESPFVRAWVEKNGYPIFLPNDVLTNFTEYLSDIEDGESHVYSSLEKFVDFVKTKCTDPELLSELDYYPIIKPEAEFIKFIGSQTEVEYEYMKELITTKRFDIYHHLIQIRPWAIHRDINVTLSITDDQLLFKILDSSYLKMDDKKKVIVLENLILTKRHWIIKKILQNK